MNTFYRDEDGNPLCKECADQTVGISKKKYINKSGEVIECDGCGEEIPFVGQTFQIRPSMSVADWER